MMLPLADRLLAAVLVSLVAAVLISASGRRPNLREAWTLAAAILKLALVVSLLPSVLAGETVETAPLPLVPGLALHLRADALGLVFALVASSLWLLTSVYSIGYMRGGGYGHQTGYYASFAVCLSATIGLAFAANLVTFFVFYEILTLATYPLVIHSRTPEALIAGRAYLVYTLMAGQALLVAIVWTLALAPGASFQAGGFLPPGTAATGWLFLLFMIGVGVKAGIMPLHGWLPAAMVAPTPVSALLHAVAVVKAGAFGCLRIVGFVFGVDLLREIGADVVLAVAASVTIILASVRALGEGHLKRRLAYSTIAQLSYIVLGAALGSAAALAGAIFHMAAHGAMKITMFFCAGAIDMRAHVDQVTDLGGIGRRMPITMSAFALCAFGLAGLPLLAGFVSKWNLGIGAVHAGHPVFVGVLILSGVLNFAYFFPIVSAAFFGPAPGGEPRFDMRDTSGQAGHEAPPYPGGAGDNGPAITAPLAITALLALVLGLFPDAGFSLYELAWQAASSMTAAAGGRP